MPSFCSNCGAQLQETSKFCRDCGTRTEIRATPVSSAPSIADQQTPVPPAPQATHHTSQPARKLGSTIADRPVQQDTANTAPTASRPAPKATPRSAEQKATPHHSAKTDQTKPAKHSGCWRGCAVTVLIMLLIAGIGALCIVKGCQPEEPPRPSKISKPHKAYKQHETAEQRRTARHETAKRDKVSNNSSSTAQPSKDTPKASTTAIITREVQKGVTISVPKGALGRSKKLEITPVTELNEVLLTAEKKLKERDIFAIAAWEVDAGLADDERLPGYYSLRVDLSELGLGRSLYNQVHFYRLTDKGDLFEYNTSIEGQIATLQGNQNSFILSAIGLSAIVLPAAVAGGTFIKEYLSEKFYYCYKDGNNWYLECPTKAGTFKLYWNSTDVDKDFYDKMKKLKERQAAIIRAAQLKHRDLLDFDNYASVALSSNADLSKAAQEALEKDPEYQKLKKQIKNVPPFIDKTVVQITTAYVYLGKKVKVKMPSYDVCFYLKKGLGQALGFQVSTFFRNPYIEINLLPSLKSTVQSGGKDWDNLLLTITHELFHICQEEYHFCIGVNSKKFDEMVTVVLEADAFAYYRKNKIITTTPELTSDGPYDYLLMYPMDKDEEGDSADEYGYTLSKFVRFIREKSGKKSITAKNLMEARDYYSRPNISDPLKKCFSLDDSKLGDYFVAYCQHAFNTIIQKFSGVGQVKLVKISTAAPVQVRMVFSGPYSCRAARIAAPKDKLCPVIIVPQENEDQAVLCIEPNTQRSQLKLGIFIPSNKTTIISEMLMVFKPGKKSTLETDMTVYTMPAPNFQELKADSEYISAKIPELSAAGKQGLTAGFILNLKPSSGPAQAIPIDPANAGKRIKLQTAKVFPKIKSGKLKFTATICEYALDKKGNRCLGALSQELSAAAYITETEETPTPTPTPTPKATEKPKYSGSGGLIDMNSILYKKQVRNRQRQQKQQKK
ncbi:zinc-ribbon domain-containing protein [bacterium]|nr:zinc-ribbon domain-containing protein [bacterium]